MLSVNNGKIIPLRSMSGQSAEQPACAKASWSAIIGWIDVILLTISLEHAGDIVERIVADIGACPIRYT